MRRFFRYAWTVEGPLGAGIDAEGELVQVVATADNKVLAAMLRNGRLELVEFADLRLSRETPLSETRVSVDARLGPRPEDDAKLDADRAEAIEKIAKEIVGSIYGARL